VTANGGRDWRHVIATGLPWQGSASSSSSTSVPGCSLPDPFNITAVSGKVALLADAGCPAREAGIWRTSDGGRQWRPVQLPAPPGGWATAEAWDYPGASQSGADVIAMRFFPHGHGVAAVTTRPGELVVYRSTDSGASWSLASVLETGSLARPAGFSASAPLVWELPAPAGLYVTTDGGRQWSLRRSGLSVPDIEEASFASPVSGIGFSSGLNIGLASTGDAGMRTADGGQSWAAVQFSAPAFLGNTNTEIPFDTVDFATPEDGWVGGADGIEATTDGGTTWEPQLATSEPVAEISFADAEHGWALTPDELFATSDGGANWSAEPETAMGAFSSVQLVSSRFGVGVICGQPGGTRAFATYDSGRSWRPLAVPDPDGLDCGTVPPSPGTMTGLCFGTTGTGWAVLRGRDESSTPGGSSAQVEKTDDGGLHWAQVATVNTWPGQLACLGTSDLWLGLDWLENMATVGALASTIDGGRTWRISVHPHQQSPFLVPSIKPSDGTSTGSLGGAQSPAGILTQPVAALASPAAGTAVDLWQDYGPDCANGFGLAFTANYGGSWVGAQGTGNNGPHCGTLAMPYLSAVPEIAPSLSFPDARYGFVLGPAEGTPAVPKGVTEPVTMALIGTADGGTKWHLLARFTWHQAGRVQSDRAQADRDQSARD
jgi:photosystem II stability/assembly factor-like uncharacterized protein